MTIPKIQLEPDNVYKSKLHRKAMNSYITLMILASIGLGGYANGQDDLASKKLVVAKAQEITSQEFVQTAEIEPLQVRNDAILPDQNIVRTLENWLKSQNPDLPAKEIAECSYKYTTERKINHFLPLAITEKESRSWSHYKILKTDPNPEKSKWIDFYRWESNFQEIKEITLENYQNHFIYFNGGGLMGRSKDWSDQNYSSKNLEYTLNFKGSIAGYTSYCEYLDNLTWLLDVGYLTTHSENLTKSDLDTFAKVYVGTSSYKQYSQNIQNILLKIQNN
jgi:hypothetical protein